MKRIIGIIVTMVLMMGAYAQHYQVTRSDYEQVNITFTVGDLQTKIEPTEMGNYTGIFMSDYDLSTEVGKPQLPVMVKLLQVPVCDSIVATVKNAQYVEVDASTLGIQNHIMPVQPSYSKSYRGEKTFTIDQATYAEDAFYGVPLVQVEKVGVMRDVCLASIAVAPMTYNPVTNKVRIYRSVEVEVTYENANLPATYEMQSRYGSPMFMEASKSVINPMERTRSEFSQAPIKYLIVAHSMFANNESLQNFVTWKKRLGYLVEVAYTSDSNVGTTNTSITNFIKSKYTNATTSDPAPTFVLLVGDHEQVPAASGTTGDQHVTDLYFATWTDGDNIPDCYYGRFSATSISELTPQIEKTLMYEQYTMPDPSYLGTSVLIAGTDSYYSTTHADGQINYIYNNYINTTTTAHDYTTVYKHNYDCSSQAATIRSEVSNGSGWTNYTAHGDVTEWYSPSFTSSHVASMTNTNKYGVMIGNCCLTGKFDETCFGETLLRTANKGAMAYIGASQVSYWNEDVYWSVGKRTSITSSMSYSASNLGAYDRIFHTHSENQSDWITTLGGFVHAGNLGVESSTSSRKVYYWEIYHLFGDPSIRPYLGVPSTMTVTASATIVVGSTSYVVNAVPYAYVALTYNNELVAAAFADANGSATLDVSAVTTPGEYELAVGAQNYVQYFSTVTVVAPTGPYVVATNVEVSANEYPVNGTSVHLQLALENYGVDAASNVVATLTPVSAGYTVTSGTANVGNMAAGDVTTLANAFAITIPSGAEDAEQGVFDLEVAWTGGSTSREVKITVMAPKIVRTTQMQNLSGESNYQQGDTVEVSVTVRNEGHAAASNMVTDLTCNYSGVVVTTYSQNIDYMAAADSVTHVFNAVIGSSVPDNSTVLLYSHLVEQGSDKVDTLYLTVGVAEESFETQDFTSFNWTQGSNAWYITTGGYTGDYCARSASSLGNNATSEMSVTVTSSMDGNLVFYRKVSSESNYDYFYFLLDNTQMDAASGTVDWTEMVFPITAGTHTYTFRYTKDYSQSSGSDCAWVDDITFPGVGVLVVEDTDDPVSVEDYTASHIAVSVYPNPTLNTVRISSDEVLMQEIMVYDLYGKLVMTQPVNDYAASMNLSELSNGMYLLKIMSKEEVVKTVKIIKQ